MKRKGSRAPRARAARSAPGVKVSAHAKRGLHPESIAGGIEAARAGTLLPATPSPEARVLLTPGMPRLEQIRRIGCRLIYQYGYSGMTMRQLAFELNIKAASLYHHFPSKQDLLFDLMHDTAQALTAGLLRIVNSGANSGNDARRQLDDAIRWHVLFHTQKREEAFISHSEMRSLTPENLHAILAVRERYETLFTRLLIHCQQAGVLPRRDTPESHLGVVRNAILTMCTATAGWFHPEGKLTAEEVAEEICAFIWHGLLQSSSK